MKGVKIETPEQEKITLKIFEAVLGSGTKNWASFDELFVGTGTWKKPKSEIHDIFPELQKLEEWMNSYRLQFNEISNKVKFQNSSYDVFLYQKERNNFMDYVTNLVTKEVKFVGQKDTWNPADIWLLKTGAQANFAKEVDEMLEDYKGDGKLDLDKKQRESAIVTINNLLKKAYKDNEIVGISLKKTDGKRLDYDVFNLELHDAKGDLPNVKFDSIKLDCTYDKKNHKFKSKTSQVFVNDGTRGAFKMSYKSNTGTSKVGNITYEFLPSGPAAAQLGKVPKESLKKWLTDQIEKKVNGKMVSAGVKMPQHGNLPDEWSTDVKVLWEKKVKLIISTFGTFTGLEKFVENLEKSYKNNQKYKNGKLIQSGKSVGNAAMMQMVDFTWILAKLKEQNHLIRFFTLCYYFAQKKGVKYNFGPFGKLYSK